MRDFKLMTRAWMLMVLLFTLLPMAALTPKIQAAMIMESNIDRNKLELSINEMWFSGDNREGPIIDYMKKFIAIPNLSPDFVVGDGWAEDTDKVVSLLSSAVADLKRKMAAFCKTDDITVTVYGGKNKPFKDENGADKVRTPIMLVEVPAFSGNRADILGGGDTVLLYGHLDKQPVGTGWAEGLNPREAVIRDGKMYGRGAADDGYALFSALSSLLALRAQNVGHKRCIILIESAEESGSVDLSFYINELGSTLGNVSLIVCLDSGAGDYERLWLTTSLRGVINGLLEVTVLTEGVHSGASSGITPSAFRIMRGLLSRLEDEQSGQIKPGWLQVDIPDIQAARAKTSAAILGDSVYKSFPFVNDQVSPMDNDPAELLLARAWRPALSVTGMEGFPALREAGNVTLPYARAKLSLRLPPGVAAYQAADLVKSLLERDPPYNAVVRYDFVGGGNGWAAPEAKPWLAKALSEASKNYFNGKDAAFIGEGGSIDFMQTLALCFPDAQFFITGILGPKANAHGPNEFLHLDAVQRLTMCLAHVVAAHAVN